MKQKKYYIVAAAIVCMAALLWRLTYYDAWLGSRRQARVWQMGEGINLGNSLDVDNLRERKPEAALEEYETYWGNPVIKKELFEAIAAKGFRTVRIPVTWGEHMDDEGIVDAAWMKRVKEVTDWALEAGLYVILDTHHENWIIPSEECETEVTQRFCLLWQQIADTFAQDNERLLFEGMNEPRLRGSEEEWAGGSERTRQVVNRLNQAFVDTVRKSGGNNEERWLLICPYASSHRKEALAGLEIPQDEHVIVAIHAYIPYAFTLDDDAGGAFEPYREKAEAELDELLEQVRELFIRRGTPVMITEFGCHAKPEEEERNAWAEWYLEKMKDADIPCIWWDNGKDSQIVDRESLCWTDEKLIAFLQND